MKIKFFVRSEVESSPLRAGQVWSTIGGENVVLISETSVGFYGVVWAHNPIVIRFDSAGVPYDAAEDFSLAQLTGEIMLANRVGIASAPNASLESLELSEDDARATIEDGASIYFVMVDTDAAEYPVRIDTSEDLDDILSRLYVSEDDPDADPGNEDSEAEDDI